MERHSMQPRMYIQKAVTLCGQDQYSLSGQARQGIPCSPEMIVLVDCYHSGARLFTNVAYNYSPLCVEQAMHSRRNLCESERTRTSSGQARHSMQLRINLLCGLRN